MKGNSSSSNRNIPESRVHVLFIYIGECTGHVVAWPGQFSLAVIGILGKYTAWRCVRLVLHSLLVRNTAPIPHLPLHTSGNQYLLALEAAQQLPVHHAWGFQPLPLRAKWWVISSAVWSFGQLLSCRMNVLVMGKQPQTRPLFSNGQHQASLLCWLVAAFRDLESPVTLHIWTSFIIST